MDVRGTRTIHTNAYPHTLGPSSPSGIPPESVLRGRPDASSFFSFSSDVYPRLTAGKRESERDPRITAQFGPVFVISFDRCNLGSPGSRVQTLKILKTLFGGFFSDVITNSSQHLGLGNSIIRLALGSLSARLDRCIVCPYPSTPRPSIRIPVALHEFSERSCRARRKLTAQADGAYYLYNGRALMRARV